MSKLKNSTIQCNDFDCETIQSAIYKIHFSSTGQNFGLQIRFGCAGRQSPSLLDQSGQAWTTADSITILGRTKQSFLILSSYFSPVQAPGAGWRSVTSQLLREVCPRPLSSIVPCSAPSVPQPVLTITEKAPTRAFSWLKAPTSAFTFKTLLRHYAKR